MGSLGPETGLKPETGYRPFAYEKAILWAYSVIFIDHPVETNEFVHLLNIKVMAK